MRVTKARIDLQALAADLAELEPEVVVGGHAHDPRAPAHRLRAPRAGGTRTAISAPRSRAWASMRIPFSLRLTLVPRVVRTAPSALHLHEHGDADGLPRRDVQQPREPLVPVAVDGQAQDGVGARGEQLHLHGIDLAPARTPRSTSPWSCRPRAPRG